MFTFLSLSLLSLVSSLPSPSPSTTFSSDARIASIPLFRPNTRHTKMKRQADVNGWMEHVRNSVGNKYGIALDGEGGTRKRGAGGNWLFNQADTIYFGQIGLATPQQTFFVVLDTGSSDFWLADSLCRSSGCSNVDTFDISSSSTFQNLNQPFSIQYGSGSASGTLARDTVSLANQTVSNQVFAVCDVVENDTLPSPLSGLMGLGFQTIANSRAKPLAEELADSGQLDRPVVAFAFTRFNDNGRSGRTEPGGIMTLGGVDTNLFVGEPEAYRLVDQGSYWLLDLEGVEINGQEVGIRGGRAAIDTGTSLIAGPTDVVAAIYAQIPDAQPYSQSQGYYTVPCSFDQTLSLRFGNSPTRWNISADDFVVGQVSTSRCIGGIFGIPSGRGTPDWIVGDVFLKNVYSIYDYSAPSVSFARLNTRNVEALEDNTETLQELRNPTANNGTAGATLEGGSAGAGTSGSNGGPTSSAASRSGGGALLAAFVAAVVLLF